MSIHLYDCNVNRSAHTQEGAGGQGGVTAVPPSGQITVRNGTQPKIVLSTVKVFAVYRDSYIFDY